MAAVTMANADKTEIPFVANYYPTGLAGYVYEADTHCVDCSKERFGQDLQMRVAGSHQQSYPHGHRKDDPPFDSEGNHVSAITGEMEFDCSLFCGDCGTDLSDKVSIIHYVPKDSDQCEYCSAKEE